ncbi:hypothetical protein AAFF14_005144 [Klebsiella pneumoniae]
MMKRNILAVVIPALLVAGAANAAEIYKPYSARTVISRIPSCLAVKCRTPEGI